MDKTLEFVYKEKTYKVEVTYKKIKNIIYRYRKGVLLVSCSKKISDKQIYQGLDKFKEKLLGSNYGIDGFSDNGLYLLGVFVNYNLDNRIYFKDNSYIEYKDKTDLEKKLKKFFVKVLEPRVRYYEYMMNIKNPYKVKVKNMVSRYGSNSSQTRSLNFALTLVHYSLDIIDAVIVHELAHEYIRNHSKKFYDIVLKYYPDYYNQHNKLRKKIYK